MNNEYELDDKDRELMARILFEAALQAIDGLGVYLLDPKANYVLDWEKGRGYFFAASRMGTQRIELRRALRKVSFAVETLSEISLGGTNGDDPKELDK